MNKLSNSFADFTGPTREVSQMLFPEDSYKIMGACFKVHNTMGSGFLEAVYQECLEIEFAKQQIPFVAKPNLQIQYDGDTLTQTYELDFVCYGKIIVEIKAMNHLIDRHEAQILNYLHATGLTLGLLINFGAHPKLESKRLALSNASAVGKRE